VRTAKTLESQKVVETMSKSKDTFNDKMVARTVLPAIYLWLAASAAVVSMGIVHPDVVLENLDGFIALIAIIGGIAAPALNTILRMWESEQTVEIDSIPAGLKHDRERAEAQHEHLMIVEKHREAVEKIEFEKEKPRNAKK